MLKKEYLECIEIHKKIKEEVTGNVYITIKDDTLMVYINSFKGVKYRYEYKHISYEMIYGKLNSDKIVRIIINDYRHFIMNKFFRR